MVVLFVFILILSTKPDLICRWDINECLPSTGKVKARQEFNAVLDNTANFEEALGYTRPCFKTKQK